MPKPKILAGILLFLLLFPIIARAETVHVGCIPSSEPLQDGISSRQFYKAYLDEISKYTNFDYELIFMRKDDGERLLESGDIDLLLPVEPDPYKAASGSRIYSARPFGKDIVALFTAIGDERYDEHDLGTLKNARLGLVYGRSANQLALDFNAKNNLNFTVSYFTDKPALLQALGNGEIDLVLDNSTCFDYDEKYLLSIGSEFINIAAKPDKANLMLEINRAMDTIEREDPRFTHTANDKFILLTEPQFTHFSAEESAYLKSLEKLTVVIYGVHPPFSYVDENNNIKGIYPELIAELGKNLGVNMEFTFVTDYNEAKRQIREGEADLTFDIFMQEHDKTKAMFSSPFVAENFSLIGRPGGKYSLAEPKRLAIADKSGNAQKYIADEFENWQIFSYDTPSDCLEAVENGSVDFAQIDNVTMQSERLLASHPDLAFYPSSDFTLPVCIVISRKHPQMMQSIINKSILRLPEKEINSIIFNNSARVTIPFSLRYLLRFYPLQTGIAAAVFIFIILLAVLAHHHLKEVKRQRKALAIKNEELTKTLAALNSSYAARDRYREKAEHDALTGIYNKGAIEEFAGKAIKSVNERASGDALVIIDLDHFKDANDNLGHQFGDHVLQDFAARLRELVRQGDAVGRFGGDEFVIYLKGADAKALPNIAERIMAAAANIDPTLDPPVTASIGIACIKRADITYSEYLRRADNALYYVKQNGRNNFRIFS